MPDPLDPVRSLGRSGFLSGALAVGAGAALAACTSNTPPPAAAPAPNSAPAGGASAEPGRPVTIGFSAPAADHGWIAASRRTPRPRRRSTRTSRSRR